MNQNDLQCNSIIKTEDEDFIYCETEYISKETGKKYLIKQTYSKIDAKTGLPMHLSKQRIRFSNLEIK